MTLTFSDVELPSASIARLKGKPEPAVDLLDFCLGVLEPRDVGLNTDCSGGAPAASRSTIPPTIQHRDPVTILVPQPQFGFGAAYFSAEVPFSTLRGLLTIIRMGQLQPEIAGKRQVTGFIAQHLNPACRVEAFIGQQITIS
jgi:hypothetical protein